MSCAKKWKNLCAPSWERFTKEGLVLASGAVVLASSNPEGISQEMDVACASQQKNGCSGGVGSAQEL